jgi:hypothetical protein
MTARTDKLVDKMLKIYKNEAVPVACTALDTVFRPFMHWIDTAQQEKANPSHVRGAILGMISSMILEAAVRMGERDEDGERIPMEVWLGEFVLDLRDELIQDLDNLTKKTATN